MHSASPTLLLITPHPAASVTAINSAFLHYKCLLVCLADDYSTRWSVPFSITCTGNVDVVLHNPLPVPEEPDLQQSGCQDKRTKVIRVKIAQKVCNMLFWMGVDEDPSRHTYNEFWFAGELAITA